jgi:hypothetical protein
VIFENIIYIYTIKKVEMKVIFLDHDGVICLSTEWGGRFKKQREAGRKLSQSIGSLPVLSRFDNFNKKAVDTLNEILEETSAEIVISSDWKRWASVEEMGEYYESQGIKKKPIAFTKNLGECDVPENFIWSPRWDLEQTRSLEIHQYLKDHPEVTEWVSVDDLDMGKGEEWKEVWALNNFVLTPRSTEGIKQTGVKEKIIKFLSDEQKPS